MARATYARVLVRLGGALYESTFWTEAKVTALCTQADYIIDGYTYPDTISTTSNIAIEIGVDVVLNMMEDIDRRRKSGGVSTGEGYTYTSKPILTDDIKQRIDNLKSVTYFGITTVDFMEE